MLPVVPRPSPLPYPMPPPASTTNNNLAVPSRPYPPRKSSAQNLPLQHQASSSSINPASDYRTHRKRSSQGFFEPSLRSTTSLANMGGSVLKTPSALAAQAAMGGGTTQHIRRRSQTIPDPVPSSSSVTRKTSNTAASASAQRPQAAPAGQQPSRSGQPPKQTGPARPGTSSAASASAFARSPPQIYQEAPPKSPPRDEAKPAKEKSRIKLFSKPKTLNLSKEKEAERRPSTLSPSKVYGSNVFARSMNQSTTSLADSSYSGTTSSMYSSLNASTSTLVPDRSAGEEKEKHKHNFLSRQKHKLGTDHFNLPLSSASSNSRPTDPNAPQSLYSFAPSSPAPGSTFSKSISGLDLRHGGRALREKKREEKAAQAGMGGAVGVEHAGTDWPGASSYGGTSYLGPPSANGMSTPFSGDFGPASQPATVFSLANVTAEDAWPLLQARILGIFSGEDVRTPIEDLNKLVVLHLQRCIVRKAPSVIIEDVRELLQTGFVSLDQTLRRIPDERLVPYLVDMWSSVFGTVLPFMQAVLLPLDLEFKGRGSIMKPREAAEFWGVLPIFASKPPPSGPPSTNISQTRTMTGPSSLAAAKIPVSQLSLGEALDVRTLVLLSFRDSVILPRYDILLTIFSRLPFESFTTEITSPRLAAQRSNTTAPADLTGASYNSQSSTLLSSTTATSSSLGARSRATSNTSAGSFHSLSSQRPHPQQLQQQNATVPPTSTTTTIDPAKITQIAARMLQCISVLAGLQAPGAMLVPIASGVGKTGFKSREQRISEEIEMEDGSHAFNAAGAGDPGRSTRDDSERRRRAESSDPEIVARKRVEALARELKLNWLGRGRTGRQRKGFVGSKARTPLAVGMGVGVAA